MKKKKKGGEKHMGAKHRVAGAVLATAVGVAAGAAAVTLSDKKNREKLGKAVNDLTKRANKLSKDSKPMLKSAKKISEDVRRDAKPAVRQITKAARGRVN